MIEIEILVVIIVCCCQIAKLEMFKIYTTNS
jgi:hypothetical protein